MSEVKKDPEAASKTLNAFWNCQNEIAPNLPKDTEGRLIAVVSARPEDLIALRKLVAFQMQTFQELASFGFGLLVTDNLGIAENNIIFEGFSEAYRRLLLVKQSMDAVFREIRSQVDKSLGDSMQ